jgi:hypothetical protein
MGTTLKEQKEILAKNETRRSEHGGVRVDLKLFRGCSPDLLRG